MAEPRRGRALDAGRALVVTSSVVPVFLIVVLAELITGYDRLSYRAHAETIRRLLPWRPWSLVAPALPLFALSVPQRTGGLQPGLLLLWLAGGLLLAEVYAVCLHREAWIASFEPQFIAEDATPLGGAPPMVDDRRLHFLIRTQAIYALAPVSVAVLLTTHSSPPSLLIAAAFVVKLVGHASSDYEVCFHWQLHCRVLALRGRPRLSSLWDRLCEYGLGPLWGYLPCVYRAEHLLIHHPENSGPEDSSSLLPFSKTSFLEFCIFAGRILWSHLLAADVARHRRCRGRVRRTLVIAVCAYWLTVGALLYSGALLGIWLLVLALHRGVTAARSQYIWHGLVDPMRPRDPIASTVLWIPGAEAWAAHIERARNAMASTDSVRPLNGRQAVAVESRQTVVPVPGTDWAYFDNYHLLHHRYPKAHYSEYPSLLVTLVPEVLRQRAVVMDMRGIDDFAVRCWSGDVQHIAGLLLSDPGDVPAADFVASRLTANDGNRSSYGGLCSTAIAQRANRVLVSMLALVTRFR